MIISTDAENTFDKIQHPFMIKTLQKVGIKGTHLNIIKAIYSQPTETLSSVVEIESISTKSGTRQGCPLPPLLSHIVLEVIHSNQRRKRNERNSD